MDETSQARQAVPNELVDTPQADVPTGTSLEAARPNTVDEAVDSDAPAPTPIIVTETETVEILVPETMPIGHEAVNDTSLQTNVPAPEFPARSSFSTPPVELTRIVTSLKAQEVSADIERATANTSRIMSIAADRPMDQLEGPSTRQSTPRTIDPALIHVRPASELLGQPSHKGADHATPSPKISPKKRRRSDVPAGSTPLRQEILRAQEKRQRVMEHQAAVGHSPYRAKSPDKIPAFVGIPPRIPRPSKNTTPAPPPRPARTPSPELTPAERHEKVIRGSQIVSEIAAQYRAKVGVLIKRYGIGPKEIAAATKEMKEAARAGGASGLDWDRLDSLLAEKYGGQGH